MECLVDARSAQAQGLVWDEQAHRLFWIDTPVGKLFSVSLTSGIVQSWLLPCPVGAIALCRDGRMLVTLLDGVYLFDLNTHDLDFVAALDAPWTDDGLDGGVGPDGAFWISGTGKQIPGTLLRVMPDGTTRRIGVMDALSPAGIGWSADGSVMYGADLDGGWLGRWAFDPATGGLSEGARFVTRSEHLATPSGGAVDVTGAYWSCDATGGCISRFSATGELMMRIPLPVSAPTACCFGGADMRLLFVASRRAGVEARTLMQYPSAGGIFMIPVEIAGVRVRRFQAQMR